MFSPKANDKYLWMEEGGRENGFRLILSEPGNRVFKKVHLESVFSILNEFVEDIGDK